MSRIGWYPVVALTALAFGFFFATQLRSQLIPPSAQVARNQALVGTVTVVWLFRLVGVLWLGLGLWHALNRLGWM